MADIIAVRRVKLRRIIRYLKEEHVFRDRSDPFSMAEEDFRDNFCLSRCAVKDLCNELKPLLETKSTVYSTELQVLSALRVLQSNTFQNQVSSCDFLQVSQSTMSRNLDRFLAAILQVLPNYIKFPTTADEVKSIEEDFHKSTGFPGLIGCLDCMYVRLLKPSEEQYLAFLNHKNQYTLNIQVVCDSDMKIVDVVARWPGSTHNYLIWKKSTLRCMFETALIPQNFFLIGDCIYPLEPWLLTPYIEPSAPRLKHFNTLHKNALNKIKKCIYLLQNRFRCLNGDAGKLLYAPDKVCKIVLACCILHNICLKYNVEYDLGSFSEEDSDTDVIESEFTSVLPQQLKERGLLFRSVVASEL